MPADGVPPETLLAQYKTYVATYVAHLGNVGTRYATAQTFYMSVVSAFVTVIAFIVKDGRSVSHSGTVVAGVLVFVVLICFVWRHTLLFYSQLFAVKFAILREMEKSNLFPIYENEHARLSDTRRANR